MKLCEKKRKKRRQDLESADPTEKRILIDAGFYVCRKRGLKKNMVMFQSQQIITNKLKI